MSDCCRREVVGNPAKVALIVGRLVSESHIISGVVVKDGRAAAESDGRWAREPGVGEAHGREVRVDRNMLLLNEIGIMVAMLAVPKTC